MKEKEKILKMLGKLHPSEAIALIESIGKDLRRKNSIRISNNIPYVALDLDRPDLEHLKN